MNRGFVYFVGDGDIDSYKFVKIGWTKGYPSDRCKDLQVGNPTLLTVLTFLEGTLSDESRLQSRYAKFCIRGEWFSRNAALHDQIVSLVGREPELAEKPPESSRVIFQTSVPDELATRITAEAKRRGMSIAAYIRSVLEAHTPHLDK